MQCGQSRRFARLVEVTATELGNALQSGQDEPQLRELPNAPGVGATCRINRCQAVPRRSWRETALPARRRGYPRMEQLLRRAGRDIRSSDAGTSWIWNRQAR